MIRWDDNSTQLQNFGSILARHASMCFRFVCLILSLMGFIGTTCGCRVGPDFKRPPPPYLQQGFGEAPKQQDGSPSDASDPQMNSWWNYFDDATLQGLLIEASGNNLGVREAYFRIVESRARVGIIRADWFPQLNGKADWTYRNISENASQFVSQNQNGGGFPYQTMGFDTSWEIDLFGRIARNVEAASAELLSQEESLNDVRVTLLADVATAYVQVRVLQQRLMIARQNLELQKQTLNIVRARQNSGLVGQLDETEAESNVLSTLASIPPIEQELQTTLYRLSVLLGRTPSKGFQLAEEMGKLPMVAVENIYPGAPAALLTRRPDIRKAGYDVMAANARIGAAIADRLPQLTIRGDISVEARDIAVLYSPGSIVHSVGPGFKWNLLNWGRLKSNVDARRAVHEQTLLKYQSIVLRAVQEVESALVELDRQKVRAKELENVVAVTWRSVEISRMRYEQNLVNFDRVLDAQRSLATAEGNLAVARGDVIFSLIRAYKALGGGWQNPPDQQSISNAPFPSAGDEDCLVLPIERGAEPTIPELQIENIQPLPVVEPQASLGTLAPIDATNPDDRPRIAGSPHESPSVVSDLIPPTPPSIGVPLPSAMIIGSESYQ